MTVPFLGFAEDCLVRGVVQTDGRRLSDLLAAWPQIVVAGPVVVEALEDGRRFELPELTLAHDDLCLVELGGPRGDARQRLRVAAQRLVARVGPYRLTATLHTPPSTAPIAGLTRRPLIVPMTDAVIEFESGGAHVRYELATVGVNRDRIDSLEAAYSVSHVGLGLGPEAA